jgi:hypothetical protein
MKQRIHDALLGLVGLAGIAFFALSGASCEAPTMQCAVGHGPFAVVYEVTSGDPACYEAAYKASGEACDVYGVDNSLPACAGLAKVEHVGFQTYLTPLGRRDVKDDTGKVVGADADLADYNTRNIAVQSSTMGATYRALVPIGTVPPDGSGEPWAFGPYTSKPDAGNLCYAGGASGTAPLSVAEINFPDPAGDLHFRQTWSDVEFYVTAGVPGTQVAGKMKFEDVAANCQVEYKFTGVYPAVFCGKEIDGYVDAMGVPHEGHEDNDMDPSTPSENDTDDDGDPNTPVTNDKDDDGDPSTPVSDDDGKPGPDVDVDELIIIRYDPDQTLCDPKADPASGRVFGSGINPDFKTVCHPEYIHCVLEPGTGLIQ